MRQRAALARAFISRPQVLRFYESFGALDALTPMVLQNKLRDLIRELRPTALLVAHDLDEASFPAESVSMFSARPARVLQDCSPAHCEKTHDLSDFAEVRRRILGLAGIHAEDEETTAILEGAGI